MMSATVGKHIILISECDDVAPVIVCGLICLANVALAADPLKFKRTVIDEKFRSEGVAVADFNKDGKLDIAAGSVWYAAPDWKMNVVREKADEYDPNKYSDSFVNAADDLNGDGWADLMVVISLASRPGVSESAEPTRRVEEARHHTSDQQRKPAIHRHRRRWQTGLGHGYQR